jgi:hypothetical protein
VRRRARREGAHKIQAPLTATTPCSAPTRTSCPDRDGEGMCGNGEPSGIRCRTWPSAPAARSPPRSRRPPSAPERRRCWWSRREHPGRRRGEQRASPSETKDMTSQHLAKATSSASSGHQAPAPGEGPRLDDGRLLIRSITRMSPSMPAPSSAPCAKVRCRATARGPPSGWTNFSSGLTRASPPRFAARALGSAPAWLSRPRRITEIWR